MRLELSGCGAKRRAAKVVCGERRATQEYSRDNWVYMGSRALAVDFSMNASCMRVTRGIGQIGFQLLHRYYYCINMMKRSSDDSISLPRHPRQRLSFFITAHLALFDSVINILLQHELEYIFAMANRVPMPLIGDKIDRSPVSPLPLCRVIGYSDEVLFALGVECRILPVSVQHLTNQKKSRIW